MISSASLTISTAWLLVPLLVAVILYDLRFMKIPNVLVGLFLLLFIVSAPTSLHLSEIAWRVLAALVVLIVGILAFAARLVGGGDAKILAVLTLLIPTPLLAHFALIFAVFLVLGIVALSVTRMAFSNVSTGWQSLNDRRRYPMGLSIGMAGIALLCFGAQIVPTA